MTKAWHVLLVNQFHDVLPGTSIGPVNERARAELAAVAATADALATDGLPALPSGEAGAAPAPVNTLPWPRREVASDPAGALVLCEAPPCAAGRIVEPSPDDRATLERTPDGGAGRAH